MQFLKTLFWVLIAVLIALLASRNWVPVPLWLWGDIVVDIKLPLLLLLTFTLGWLPTWLIMRARLWNLKRRLEAVERSRVEPVPASETEDEGRAACSRSSSPSIPRISSGRRRSRVPSTTTRAA